MRKEVFSFNHIEVLSEIPVNLNLEKVLKRLKVSDRQQKEQIGSIKKLVQLAGNLIAAKAAYKVSYVEDKKDARVSIEEVEFESKVLRKNLEKIGKVFPYIITIGKDLENRATSANDLLEQFYLEEIADLALEHTLKKLQTYLQQKYRPGRLSRMSPGSLKDWPITEQRKLFSLFGDTQKIVGVSLTDSYLMIPRKSISGILFPTEINFYSCKLCPRERCERRKAPYDPKLKESYNLG
ncbi:hypothetical protein IBX65_06875 [Candidatus Aerophobetes bacterium]|nr:hypothetical protein [Candidatus Aerophobetes bacterium]